MANFVQRALGPFVRRLFLKEEPDCSAGVLEVEITGMTLVTRREDRAHGTGIEFGHQLRHARLQRIAILGRQISLQDEKAVPVVSRAVEPGHWVTRPITTGR